MLLVDIGSTFTKVVAADPSSGGLIGTAIAPTTIDTDVNIGLGDAVRHLEKESGIPLLGSYARVCSSAAGGLRMVAVGLVPSLTTQAARFACLGAGAKLLKAYSYELSIAEIDEINRLQPDIILLVGGTDGGERRTVLHNARQISRGLRVWSAVLLAANKTAAPEAEAALRENNLLEVHVAENVMPELNRLNLDPARSAIRDIFLRHITRAKGVDRLRDGDFQVDILMPTPEAVLQGAEILALGVPGDPGLGDLIVVDIGGATTDVHSVGAGASRTRLMKGLLEPFAKRTVEGDLGLRSNALTLIEAAGEEIMARCLAPSMGILVEQVCAYATRASSVGAYLPQGPEEACLDTALAVAAGGLALERHAGRVERILTPGGPFDMQYGKDLTDFGTLIATGGVVAYGKHPDLVLSGLSCWKASAPVLMPRAARLFVDRGYLLFAGGLLRGVADDLAVRLMKRSLVEIPACP